MNRFTANGKDLRLLTRWNAGATRPWQTFRRYQRSMPPGPSPAGHTGRPAHCHHFPPVEGYSAQRRTGPGSSMRRGLHQHPDLQRAASLRVNGVQEANWPRPAVRKTGQDRAIPAALHGRGRPFQTLPLHRSATRMAGISRCPNAEDWSPSPDAGRAGYGGVRPTPAEGGQGMGVCTARAGPAADRLGFSAAPSRTGITRRAQGHS